MFKVRVSVAIWMREKGEVEDYYREHSEALEWGAPPLNRPEDMKVAFLRKDLFLPFAPFPGLQLSAEGWDCPPVKHVQWHGDEEMFQCWVEEQFPGQRLDTYISYQDLLGMFLETGWTRPTRGGGDAPGLEPE